MNLERSTIDFYARHAFGGMERVLDRLDELRARIDAALVLHVLEELFQHLGHMEVTADAVNGA